MKVGRCTVNAQVNRLETGLRIMQCSLGHRRCHVLTRSGNPERDEDPSVSAVDKKGRRADSTDVIASELTRRFGLAGGLAWLGFLSFGVIGEQVKTRFEVATEKAMTLEIDSSRQVESKLGGTGIRYIDIKQGGGAIPQKGDLIILAFKGYYNSIDGAGNKILFVDTYDTGKPIVFIYMSRPFTAGICEGVEKALESMRAGGKRHLVIPPEYGFGDAGTSMKPTLHVPEKQGTVPPGAVLEYDIELLRVSIPP
eukprot:jgi/Picsp_1/1299/NSC_04780-R1_fk506 binding protein